MPAAAAPAVALRAAATLKCRVWAGKEGSRTSRCRPPLMVNPLPSMLLLQLQATTMKTWAGKEENRGASLPLIVNWLVRLGSHPQATTLKTWAGKEENWDAAQKILVALAKANSGEHPAAALAA